MQRRVPCLNGIELMGNRERKGDGDGEGEGEREVCTRVYVFPVTSAPEKINAKACN